MQSITGTYEYVREETINKELREISKNYGIDDVLFLARVKSFYLSNSRISVGTISKNIAFSKYVLECFGYNEEEILKFLLRNRSMVMTNYADFRARLAIFNHFGHFDEAFFKKYNLLMSTAGTLTTRDAYSILVSRPNITLDEFNVIRNSLSVKQKNELKEVYHLDNKMLRKFDFELQLYLRSKRKENINKLIDTNEE